MLDKGTAKGAGAPSTEIPDPARILDSLERGVLVLSRDLCTLYANARFTSWLGAPVMSGAEFASLLAESSVSAEIELRATSADGRPRTFVALLRSGSSNGVPRRIVCGVHRSDDALVVEARADTDGDRVALTDVARRLAEATDVAEVLRTLCEIATRQCRASGAAVLRVLDAQGEVVAATGDLLEASGTFFELKGSLLMDAITSDSIVSERNYGASNRPLMRVRPELSLGPLVIAPLRAHSEMLGVIAVARGAGAAAFDEHDVDELRILADHAALAVHKSMLLLRAQSADRAKSRFLATMSHELRTPLTALAGYHELLIDQVIGPISESQLDILERVRSVTTHLSSMIEEILSFTSLEEGHEIVRPSEFLAADLVRSAVAVVQPLADQKKLPITVNLPRAPVRMTSDIDKLRQVLVNLLGNAVKFTDTGGITVSLQVVDGVVWLDVDKLRQVLVNLLGNAVKFTDTGGITVRLQVIDGVVWIDVKDSGVGIPVAEQIRLFRPFAQVDSGLTRRHGGTGLGLYISRRLVTMLGGHIEVASEPDKGSTFRVALPLAWESGG